MARLNSHLHKLFAGADAAHYGIPDELRELRQARDRVADWYAAATDAIDPGHADRVVQEAADIVVEAARRSDLPANWAEAIHAAHADKERRERELTPLHNAADLVDRQLLAAVIAACDDLVVDHLRPALTDVIAVVRKIGPDVLELPLDDTPAMLALDDQRGKVYRRAQAQLERYRAIRGGQDALMSLLEVSVDAHHFEMVNPVEVWGEDRFYNRNMGAWTPGPAGNPIRHVVWIATGLGGQGAATPEPWLPTASVLQAAERGLAEKRRWSDRSQTLGVYVAPALA